MMRVRSKRAFALVLALGLTAAACSDDETTTTSAAPTTAGSETTEGGTETTEGGTETTEGGTETTEGTAGPLGEANPADASMDTFKVGYMWSGVSASVDNTLDLQSAEATVQWINEFGGGVAGGHPLELVPCAGSDAATAAACGSTMVESGVAIVLFNVIGDVATWAPTVLAAGIPVFAFSSADASLFANPGMVFTMSNPTAGLGLYPAKLAVEVGATRSAVVVIDVPAAVGPVQALVPPTFEALSAGPVDVVPISPTAPDHAAAIQVEMQNNPDNIHIIGNPAFCSLTIRALRDAGYTGTLSMISNCVDADMRAQLSSGELEGIYVSYTAGEDPANADYALFAAIIENYSPVTSPHGTAVGAFVVLEGFHRVMADYAGDFTSADIAAHIAGHGALDMPTITDGTFKCDGTAVAGVAIACTSNFSYSQLDAAGDPTTFFGG